ncbi:MAG: glycosyltransferase, partial [Gemmatimonadales bacterium]
MIYLCLPSHNNAATIGLLLWKIRTVFDEFPRQYQLLVADDGSTDDTLRVLKPYEKSLPLTVLKSKTYRGYAATIEDLLREAIKASDRPKRDCVITLYPDFTASPSCIPDMIRRFESGADVVIAQVETDRSSMLEQAVRKLSPALMRPGVRIPGLSDLTSGICAIRLITLRRCFRDSEVHMLQTDGPSAHAELIA